MPFNNDITAVDNLLHNFWSHGSINSPYYNSDVVLPRNKKELNDLEELKTHFQNVQEKLQMEKENYTNDIKKINIDITNVQDVLLEINEKIKKYSQQHGGTRRRKVSTRRRRRRTRR
jgi:predicted  nucleic acid-binding Zn-ribbon protein